MLQTVLNFAGVAVMGVLTGVGGRIVRDLLLDITPPYSVQNWPNITVALIAADHGGEVVRPFHRRLPTGPRELIR